MRVLKFLLREYRASIGWLSIGLITLIGGALCQVTIPVFIKLIVDSVTDSNMAHSANQLVTGWALAVVPSEPDSSIEFVESTLLIVGLLAVILAVFTFCKRWYLVRISRRTEYRLKKRMFGHLQHLPGRWFDARRSGGIMSLMTSDIEAVRMMTGPAVMYVGGTMFMFPISLLVMWSISPLLTMMAMLPLIGLTAATLWFNPRVRRYSRRSQEDMEELSARAQENFAGARVVKAFRRESFETDELEKLGNNYLGNKLGGFRNQAMFQASIFAFGELGVLIVLFFGAMEVSQGRFTSGDLAAFIMYNTQLYWPMISLGWVMMLFMRATESLKRIDALMNEPVDDAQVVDQPESPKITGNIEFRNVGLRYNDGPWVLRDVSFRVQSGKTLAIVGPVGAGKSSVANLILRMVAPTEGEILIDGVPIAELNPSALRDAVGYVPQESFLFSESIFDNIAMGVDDEEGDPRRVVEHYTEVAQLAEEIRNLPHDFDTLLGERGVNLSGGQKQRASIARALARRPQILIFDDSLSAVDTQTEEKILSGLKAESRDITTIIIAQRISTVQHADEIIVLDEGKIVERGTDQELRANNGLYADLANRQDLASQLAEETA